MEINRHTKELRDIKRGGDGGEIFIAGKNIIGGGRIEADGGDGYVGGKGGKVTLITDNNQFAGKVSAKGGTSLIKSKWWENTWIQGIMFMSAVVGIIAFILYIYAN